MTRPNNLLLAALGSLLVFSGCGKEVDDPADASNTTHNTVTAASLAADSTSLTFRLVAAKEEHSVGVPPEIFAIGERFREAQTTSGIFDSALNVGDVAPSFSLANAVGETVNSEDLLVKGPIVLTFYRGNW